MELIGKSSIKIKPSDRLFLFGITSGVTREIWESIVCQTSFRHDAAGGAVKII